MSGRWPANVILSPEMAKILDEQSGNRPGFSTQRDRTTNSGGNEWGNMHRIGGGTRGEGDVRQGYNDEGGASRFFLQAGYEPWELEWILANGLVPYTGTV